MIFFEDLPVIYIQVICIHFRFPLGWVARLVAFQLELDPKGADWENKYKLILTLYIASSNVFCVFFSSVFLDMKYNLLEKYAK